MSEHEIVERLEDIPAFENEDQEAAFWATHELGEWLLAQMGRVPEGLLPPTRPRTQRGVPAHFIRSALDAIKVALAHEGRMCPDCRSDLTMVSEDMQFALEEYGGAEPPASKPAQLRRAAEGMLAAKLAYEEDRTSWGEFSRATMALRHTLEDYDTDRECPCGACKELVRDGADD